MNWYRKFLIWLFRKSRWVGRYVVFDRPEEQEMAKHYIQGWIKWDLKAPWGMKLGTVEMVVKPPMKDSALNIRGTAGVKFQWIRK